MRIRLFTPPGPLTYDMLNQRQLTLLKFRRHKLAVAAAFLLAGLYIMALFSPFFAPYGKYERNLDYIYCPPQKLGFDRETGLHAKGLRRMVDPVTLNSYYEDAPENNAPLGFFVRGVPYRLWGIFPTDRHLFGVDTGRIPDFKPGDEKRFVYYMAGADKFGCDIWSRIVQGSTISLSVGLVGVFLSFVLGVVIGGISGYCGGVTDTAIQRVIEIINSFPQLPMWLALAAAVPADWSPLETYFAITVTLSLLSWTGLARVVRGKILSLKQQEFVLAAKTIGSSATTILFDHLIPNALGSILVTITMLIPSAIFMEAFLGYLGIGLQPPLASLGTMCNDASANLRTSPHELLIPALMICVIMFAFNFVGDGLRDALDPKLKK